MGDVSIFYKNNVFSSLAKQYFEKPDDTGTLNSLRLWLGKVQESYNYNRVFLMDTNGLRFLSLPSSAIPVASAISLRIPEIVKSKQIVFEDFYRNEYDNKICLSVLAPVIDAQDSNLVLGVLGLEIDPEQFLYPYLSSWPTPDKTSETLILRREGDEVVILNELKFQKNTALTLRAPMNGELAIPAIKAALGEEGIVAAPDYRGVPVIAAIRTISGSPWFMVARMDRHEAFAPLKERLSIIATIFGLMLIGVGLGFGFFWKNQRVRIYRENENILMKMTEELSVAREEAERANLAKSEFLSRMSHELRTPLNSILGFAQLMNMGELIPTHKKSVAHIIKSGKHLLNLINEVLNLSKIEAGKVSLSLEPVRLHEIILETFDMVGPLAAERNLTIKVSDFSENELFANADKQSLKQVLLNLMSNAVKYNRDSGSVIVDCKSLKTENEKNPTVRISITDTGSGIDPKSIKQLFIPFERINAANTEIEGTGLGLSIAKKLIEAMNGKIGVESKIGTGSTFWIELPKAEGQTEYMKRKSSFVEYENIGVQKKGTLLYIEDNQPNIDLVEQILQTYHPEIILKTEKYGKTAVDQAIEVKPDLILLDLNLPDLHGSEILKLLQDNPETGSIPVVVLSADAMPKQIERLLKIGAKGYLTKPLDVVQFLEVIDVLINKNNKNISMELTGISGSRNPSTN